MINKYFNKSITIFLTLIFIFGLFPPFVFSQPNSFSSLASSFGEVKGFNRSVFDSHFSRADREINPDRWLAEARLGITQAISAWEMIAGSLYENPLLFNEAKIQLEKWSDEELENRFSQWLAGRFFGNAAGSAMIVLSQMLDNIQINYTWHLDEDGNILFDSITGDPMIIRPNEEGRDFSQDLVNWRNDTDKTINKASISFNNFLIQLYPELLAYIPEVFREKMEAVISETSTSMNTAIKKEFEYLAAREENKFTSLRTRDIWSLRKKSNDESAKLFTEKLITETEESCNNGINELKIRIEQAEAGTGDLALLGEDWLQLYKEQFDKGLKAWEEAEERFFIRRIEWEQDSINLFSEGLEIWQDAFDQFEKQRNQWELSVKELFDAGEKLFENISDNFKEKIKEAKNEFELNMKMRIGEGSERVKALVDMYLLCASTALSAFENVKYWHNYYNISDTLSPGDEGYYSWLDNKIAEGSTAFIKIKDSYNMYTTYTKNALNARKRILENYAELFGTGLLKDILSSDVSSEDFYLDEYQIALIRAKALVLYWNKKTEIAQAVLTYAEDLTAGRMTDADGLRAMESARMAYNASLAEYEIELDKLNKIGVNIKNQQIKLNNLTARMQEEEEEFNKLYSEYCALVSASAVNMEDYIYLNLNTIYNLLVKEYKTFQNTENDTVYKKVLEKGLTWSVLEYKENAEAIMNILINGDGEEYLSLAEIIKLENNDIDLNIRKAAIDLFGDIDGLRSLNSEYSGADWYSKAKGIMLSEEEKNDFYVEKLFQKLANDYVNSEKLFFSCMEEGGENIIELFEDYIYCLGLLEIFSEFGFYSTFSQNENWQSSISALSKLLNEYDINPSNTFLPDVQMITESIKNKSGNFIQNTAQFLFDLDNCFSYVPEWLKLEINNWKNTFIKYAAIYALSSNMELLKYSEIIYLEQKEISDNMYSLFLIYEDNTYEQLADISEIEEMNKSLLLLNYQMLITEEWEKYLSLSLKNEQHWRYYLQDEYIKEKDPILNFVNSWQEGALEDALFIAAYYTSRVNDAFIMYSNKESALSDGTAIMNRNLFLNTDYVITLSLNSLEEQYKEFVNLIRAYELSKLSQGEIETKMLAKKKALEEQEKIYDAKRAEYFVEANKIINIGSLYDSQYSIFKEAYEVTEQKRFDYEKQDAIQRWASTSYLNIDNININDCETSLLRAQTVLNVLSDLYNDEEKRTYNNSEYNELYAAYKQAFSNKLIIYEAVDLITTANTKEYLKNQKLYIDYYNSLNQLGYIDQDYENYLSGSDKTIWTVKDIIMVKDGRLAFSADEIYKLTGINEDKANELNDYFDRSFTPENERYKISAYEEALRGLSERMSDYLKDPTKLKQWSLARDYLIYSLITGNSNIPFLNNYYYGLKEIEGSDKSLGKLTVVGLPYTGKTNNVSSSFSFVYRDTLPYGIAYREAWNKLSEAEKADLEFYVIITLQNDDYSRGFDKFYTLDAYNLLRNDINFCNDHFNKEMGKWYNILVRWFFRDCIRINNNTLNRVESAISELNMQINKFKTDLSVFLFNINTNASEYKNSCDTLNVIEGVGENVKNIVWDDIKLALKNDMKEEKINELKKYWEIMQNYPGNTYKCVTDALLDMQQLIIYEESLIKNNMELFWKTAVKNQKDDEINFLSAVDSYISGTLNIDELTKTAEKAYGENAASQKNHLLNKYNVMLDDLSLYLETDVDFNFIFNALGEEIFLLNEKIIENRYAAELAAREAEWNQALKDINNKKAEWQKTAEQIIEAGRTDWIASKEKLENAKNQWTANFIKEYNRVGNEWNLAYLAGLEDKERWLKQAADAANNASADAFLSLVGAEGERLSRFVDTREPLGIVYEAPEAHILMSELLQSSGIINMSNAFNLLNNIASTASSNVKRGMGGISIWDSALVRTAASDLARTTNQEIANMEAVKLAYNVRKHADEAINILADQVNYANKSFRTSMDDYFILNGLWTRSGKNYVKDIIKSSSLFGGMVSEKAVIIGYYDYKMEPITLQTNLDENYLVSLDTLAIRGLLDNAIMEIKVIAGEIFGKEGEEAKEIEIKKFYKYSNSAYIKREVVRSNSTKRMLSPGKFGAHLGYVPDIKEFKDMGSDKSSMFYDKGSGELGRMMTDYIYWAVIDGKGNAELLMAPWEKKLWNDEGSEFKAPSLRAVGTIACSIIAGIATAGIGGIAGIAMSVGIASASEFVFSTYDLVYGYKDFDEVALNLRKSILTNTVSSVAGGLFNGFGGETFLGQGLTKNAMGLVNNSFSKVAVKTAMTGLQTLTTSVAITAISGITLEDGKLSFNKNVFNDDYWKGLLINSLTSMTSTFVSTGLTEINSGLDMSKLIGNSNLDKVDLKKLNDLLGALAGQGVNYAMGNDFTLNIFSLGLFNNGKNSAGLIELHLGRDGTTVNFGTGGANVSFDNIIASIRGAHVWNLNNKINKYVSNEENNFEYAIPLRAQYGYGDEVQRKQLYDILNKITSINTNAEGDFSAETTRDENGNKVINLTNYRQGLSIEEQFLIAVLLGHEAHRDGYVTDDNNLETRIATMAHTEMALRLLLSGQNIAFNQNLMNDISEYLSAFNLNDMSSFYTYIDGNYDSSADYWKLMRDGTLVNDNSGWLVDELGKSILNAKGERIGANEIEQGLLNILFGGTHNVPYNEYSNDQVALAQLLMLSAGMNYHSDKNNDVRTRKWTSNITGQFLDMDIIMETVGSTIASPVFARYYENNALSDIAFLTGNNIGNINTNYITNDALLRYFDNFIPAVFNYYSTMREFLDPSDNFIIVQKHGGTNLSYPNYENNAHFGTDFLNGRSGDPIYMGISGNVIHTGAEVAPKVGNGNWMAVEYGYQFEGSFIGSGIFGEYMHMQVLPNFANNTFLNSNQIIGTVGNSGRSTGAHLHYSIYTLESNSHSQISLQILLNNNTSSTVRSREAAYYIGTYKTPTKKVTYDIENYLRYF